MEIVKSTSAIVMSLTFSSILIWIAKLRKNLFF